MIVKGVSLQRMAGKVRAQAILEFEGTTRFKHGEKAATLWFEWPENYFNPGSIGIEPFVLVSLTLAMGVGENITLEEDIDPIFYLNLLEAIDIYHSFFPEETSVIGIHARCKNKSYSASERVGSFFSGGIDSLFNVADLKKMNALSGVHKVTDLWLVQGMDIPLNDNEFFQSTYDRLTEMASIEGLNVIPLKTNARELQDGLVKWTTLGFGVILGAIAKIFSDAVSTVLIGSFEQYKKCMPNASAPLIDPMWSCSKQTVRHYSARYSRIDKIKVIADYAPGLLSQARVCWKNTSGSYNCGCCEKCLRTLSELRLANASHLVNSFPEGDVIKLISGFRLEDSEIAGEFAVNYWRQIHAVAAAQGDQALKSAVEPVLQYASSRGKVIRLKKMVRAFIRRS
ncbi:hypothetical protein MWU49_12355 [Alcanivorax sp. S6407]|uniref:hypothetical protein n=1 Tax=Alcanivorax sp. S6407 TaxID=2926424 RepID=UPI001FF19508|nr:hypothetical protein [Alcanivorax sp. S6407]MCK0154501.1 hypothetical protein [Alcanivorax sp. S6407]